MRAGCVEALQSGTARYTACDDSGVDESGNASHPSLACCKMAHLPLAALLSPGDSSAFTETCSLFVVNNLVYCPNACVQQWTPVPFYHSQ